MRIHYYMQYFPGEDVPGTQQPVTLAKRLARRGHQVTVVSTDHNLDSEVPEVPVSRRYDGGGTLDILRLQTPRGGRGSLPARLRAYVDYMLVAQAKGLSLARPDVILGSIPSLFAAWGAMMVSKARRVPFVLEIRDLWPDFPASIGLLSPWASLPLHGMARLLYWGADRIVSLTPGIRRELLKKAISESKIDVLPNGFDPALYRESAGLRESVRREEGWGDDLVGIYTGSFTKVTAVDVLVRAAGLLRDRRGIRFDLFGQGPTLDAVVALARELRADNVHFHRPVPKARVPALLAGADVALMSLERHPLSHIFFENKFIDYMGAGKPIVAAMEGEQADIVGRWGTGRVAPPGDAAALARFVAEAREDFAPYAEMGARGRKLVHDRLLLPSILERYADVLEATGRRAPLPAWQPAL